MLRRSLRRMQFGGVKAMEGDVDFDTGSKKLGRHRGFYRGGEFKMGKDTAVRYRETTKMGEEEVAQRGVRVQLAAQSLRKKLDQMENPMVWIWYPWRTTPEPPLPSFPCPNALKNLNGAFIPELTDEQHATRAKALRAGSREEFNAPSLDKIGSRHPFLQQILKETAGQRKGFPFFFKRYPTRRFATETRFSIPEEMLEGMQPEIQRALSPQNMSPAELIRREKELYRQRYMSHEMEENNTAMATVSNAIVVREWRNHLLSHPNNNVGKTMALRNEAALRRKLLKLRRENFRQYWEIVRDHDMMDVVQPKSLIDLRLGGYWRRDWELGRAITSNYGDFIDPRGLSGCIETGRSRAEVARDLGLNYTRPLKEGEKKHIANQTMYFERLQRLRTELPDAFIERERSRFIAKFTGVYCRATTRNAVPDFPQFHRHLIHRKIVRWKSKRHGPC